MVIPRAIFLMECSSGFASVMPLYRIPSTACVPLVGLMQWILRVVKKSIIGAIQSRLHSAVSHDAVVACSPHLLHKRRSRQSCGCSTSIKGIWRKSSNPRDSVDQSASVLCNSESPVDPLEAYPTSNGLCSLCRGFSEMESRGDGCIAHSKCNFSFQGGRR